MLSFRAQMRKRAFKRVAMRTGKSGGFGRPSTVRARRRSAQARFRMGARAIFPVVMTRGARVFSIEQKFHDVDLIDAGIAQNGTIIADSINKIAQGVTETTRIGRKCTIRSINWRFRINLAAGTASNATAEVIRIIMYLDKQANGATATITDILETNDFQSFNNLANKSRFRTLMDRQYDLNATAGGGDGTTEDYGEVIVTDTLFKKVNIPIEFDSTTGAITEIRSNNIGVLILAEAGAISNFASKIRLRFTDL